MKNPRIPRWGVLWAVVATAQAAPITWTTGPTPTLDESAISLTGTLSHAGRWGAPNGSTSLAVPVGSESIIFQNSASAGALGVNNASASGGSYTNGDVWIPPGATDANFNSIMDGSAPDGDNPKVVIIGGLVVGKNYQIQLFASDDRSCCSTRTMEWSDNSADGVGHETATFTLGSSSYVIGTFTADATSQTIYARGVAQPQNYANAYVLRDLSPDTDGDKIPDYVEDGYPFLNKNNAADALLDQDGDGLSNLEEYQRRLNLTVADTDGDGLNDEEEVNTYGTNPKLADTDGDTLSDGAEINIHNSSPTQGDSDNDLFPDRYEAAAGSLLNDSNSTPNGTHISFRGTGTASLVGFDLTDPENDLNDTTNSGFNWVALTSSSDPSFATQAAGNVFDNKIGGGEAKWCCDSAPQFLTVQFASYTSLQYFTISSGEDSPERDPRQWEIQGSNDGINFAPITKFDYTANTLWTQRSQVLRVDLAANAKPYKYIRYQVFSTGSNLHAISEIEYFGTQNNNDGDADGIPQLFEVLYPGILSDSNAADAAADTDGDGLTNLQEFQAGTNFQVADTDGDGLNDGPELTAHTNPFKADTDGDGLSDGDEVNIHHSDPLLVDTDGDFFRDGYEVSKGSNPTSAASTPGGVQVSYLGLGTGALIGHDITDRENNGSDVTLAGSGFDWTTITATSKADFAPAEGAFNVFDNKLGGGEAKWCCDSAPQSITVQMPFGVSLTHFTLASSNDSPERDPRVWAIQGSNDGVTFTNIFSQSDATMGFWTDRNQVVKFTLTTTAPMYKWFRYSVTAAQSTNQHALGEIEYFGIEQDTDNDGLPDYYEAKYGIANPGDDADGDGLTNLQEYTEGTIPNDNDTDDDGLTDGNEFNNLGTSPLLKDSDFDQIPDGFEVAHGGDPTDSLSLPDFAPVDWTTPANITGNLADFNTSGTLVAAWTGGTTPVTIPGLAGLTFNPGPSLGAPFTGFDPYNRNLNADYETLLNSGTYSGANGRFIEIPNVVTGQSYRIQIWVADTRPGTANRTFRFGTFNAGDEVVSLEAGASGSEATKPGQFVTGTFTAIDKVHYIYMDSATDPGAQYNAITVYATGATPAPLKVTGTSLSGGVFNITVTGFNTTKSYQLTRSTALTTFSNVGVPFTPAASTQVVTDPAPPAGKAFYRITELP